MDELANLMRREAETASDARAPLRVAKVTSYNPKTHAVKVKLLPEGQETGWMPLGSHHIGNGFGIAVGATVGDQVVVGFLEGDHSTPIVMSRLYSDQQRPPEVKSGEMVLFHEKKSALHFDEHGQITIKHGPSGGSLLWDKDGAVHLDNGDRPVKIAGNIQFNG